MKKLRPSLLLLSAVFAVLLGSRLSGAILFPQADGPVNDFTGVLDAPVKAALLAKVREVKDRTGDEIFVAVVPSLKKITVEEYANKLFAQWGPGQKGKDNGILVVVCPSEHKVRIEVGYGLEGVVTDGRTGSIIRKDFFPAFKRGDYGGGLTAGMDELAGLLERPGPVPEGDLEDDLQAPSFKLVASIGLCLFCLLGSLFFGIGLGNKVVLAMIFGGIFAGAPLWLSFVVPIFNGARIYLLGTAAAGSILGFLIGMKSGKKGGSRGSNGGNWTMGQWGNSSDDGSGGGSSWGGGGSSGGGGASGSW